MKLVERKNKLTDKYGIYLEEITQDDICWSNMEGRPNMNSPFYDPNKKPAHYITLWFKEYDPNDMAILKAFQDVHVVINGPRSEYDIIMKSKSESQYIKQMQEELMQNKKLADEYKQRRKFTVQFKAYLGTKNVRRTDRQTGEEYYEEVEKPRVMMRTQSGKARSVAQKNFNLIDSARIAEMNFKFHLYQWDERKPDCVPAIDDLYIVTQERDVYEEDDHLEQWEAKANEKYGVPSRDEEEAPF